MCLWEILQHHNRPSLISYIGFTVPNTVFDDSFKIKYEIKKQFHAILVNGFDRFEESIGVLELLTACLNSQSGFVNLIIQNGAEKSTVVPDDSFFKLAEKQINRKDVAAFEERI